MKIRPHHKFSDLIVFLDDNGGASVDPQNVTAREFWLAVDEYRSHTNQDWLKENPRCGFNDCCGGDCAGIPSIAYERNG